MFLLPSRLLSALPWSVYLFVTLAAARALTGPTPHNDLAVATKPSGLSATLPPPGFTLGPAEIGTVPVYIRTVFALVNDALGSLAAEPFESRISRPQIYESPNARLALSGPHDRGGFDVKHMVWALTLVIRRMVDINSFRNYRYNAKLNGNSVGHVWIMYKTPGEGSAANSTALTATLQPLDLGAVIQGPNPNPFAVRVSTIRGPVLSFVDAMMAIISGLTNIAPHDMSSPVGGDLHPSRITSTWPPFRARFGLANLVPPSVTAPVWFKYEVVLQALKALAREVLISIRIPQLQIDILYNRSLWGAGVLMLIVPSQTKVDENITVA
ncbi:MAG: hypothetical protein Q9205_007812 [Flavoplaca limonia]